MNKYEFGKQVDAKAYEFKRYMALERWNSLWYQLREVSRLAPTSVLEVGPGPGLFKTLCGAVGIPVETLDFDPELKPDHIGSATNLPFEDDTYDVVCAFQVLEHLPYDVALEALTEFRRVSRRAIVISLPDARRFWRLHVQVPLFGAHSWVIPNYLRRPNQHVFDGEHYWEINRKQWPLARVVSDLALIAPLEYTYRPYENPSHRFFVFQLHGSEE